jgi:hypothetical protein
MNATRTWEKIEAGLYQSSDGVLVESCRHYGEQREGWYSTYPEERIPGGWNLTLKSAKLDAGA